MVKVQKNKGSLALIKKTENDLLLLIKELELAIALSPAILPGQSRQLKSTILKLVKHFQKA